MGTTVSVLSRTHKKPTLFYPFITLKVFGSLKKSAQYGLRLS